jgi:hypothetical protein
MGNDCAEAARLTATVKAGDVFSRHPSDREAAIASINFFIVSPGSA